MRCRAEFHRDGRRLHHRAGIVQTPPARAVQSLPRRSSATRSDRGAQRSTRGHEDSQRRGRRSRHRDVTKACRHPLPSHPHLPQRSQVGMCPRCPATRSRMCRTPTAYHLLEGFRCGQLRVRRATFAVRRHTRQPRKQPRPQTHSAPPTVARGVEPMSGEPQSCILCILTHDPRNFQLVVSCETCVSREKLAVLQCRPPRELQQQMKDTVMMNVTTTGISFFPSVSTKNGSKNRPPVGRDCPRKRTS